MSPALLLGLWQTYDFCGVCVQVKGIPTLVFDVGGIHEMLDFQSHGDVIVQDPSVEGLAAKIQGGFKPGNLLLSIPYG